MGYTDLTIQGSDMAAGCAENVGNIMAKALSEEFKVKENEFNTDGPINVAMFFEEVICPNEAFIYNDKLRALAQRVVKYLDKHIVLVQKSKDEEWDGKQYHLRRYRGMKKTIVLWLSE